MAGLNFQTQTIINVNQDPNSNNSILFEKVGDVIRIKRDFTFDPKYIESVHVREGYNHEPCKATIDFSKIINKIKPSSGETNYCRLEIYVTIEGAEPFMYSTPFAQKGKPFWVEFAVTSDSTANTVAKEVEKLFKQHNIFVLDKDVVTLTLSGSVITLTGNTEYQRFGDITLHVFDAYGVNSNKVAKLTVKSDTNTTPEIELVERGYNGFGTYSHIVKDLRLPTAANTGWTSLRQAETPIVGALYTQFTIEYCAPSPNTGMQAVGQKMMSHTTHVFWVKNDLADSFKAMFSEVITVDKDGSVTVEEPTEEPTSEELDS